MEMPVQRYAVGIDLGTTFSSLAYIDEQGRPQAVRMTDDDATIGSTSYSLASAVYFKSQNEVVIGNRALDYSVIDASRLATRFKRQMGEPVFHVDRHDEQDSRTPFVVDGQTFRPEELSALVLKRLKLVAEAQLGPIREVVISVPFVFDEARRRATQHAGRIAGFERIELIDEPVAAAIAFGHNLFQEPQFRESELQHLLGDQRILVYDLGGGTFDATVVQLRTDGVFDVLATSGDERLGGSDWDEVLLNIICEEFRQKLEVDPRCHSELMQELLLRTIEAKKTLSARPRAEVEVEFGGQSAKFIITVSQFERETRHLVARTSSTINDMLAQKDWSWSYCDRILVVGGASRMPMIVKHIRTIADRDVDMSLSPDTAVAFGAGLFAALKFGHKSDLITDVQTVNSQALGLLVKNARTQTLVNDIVIPQNTKTRTKVVKTYRVQDSNREVTLIVMQGNSPDPNICLKIGKLRIAPPGRGTSTRERQPLTGRKGSDVAPGADSIAVTYGFQDNGLLHVEGVINQGAGRPPVKAEVELQVENAMSEQQVDDSIIRNRGINIA
jgi:molecular chaperone DnaK